MDTIENDISGWLWAWERECDGLPLHAPDIDETHDAVDAWFTPSVEDALNLINRINSFVGEDFPYIDSLVRLNVNNNLGYEIVQTKVVDGKMIIVDKKNQRNYMIRA